VLSGGFVACGNIKNTISIKIESNLNLRGTSGCHWDTLKVEFSESVAILGHGALTFEDLNLNNSLVSSVGGENLGLLGGDSSVTLDEDRHDTTSGLDTLGKGNDVEEEQVLDSGGLVTIENSSLDGGTVSDGLIGVDGLVKLLTVEEFGKHLLNLGDTGGATNENDLVNLSLCAIRVLEDLLYWGHALLEVGNAKFLELGAGKGGGEILTVGEGLAEDLSLEST